MTIVRRLGIGYAVIISLTVLVLGWLFYHEFIAEKADFAAMGLPDIDIDMTAEIFTVVFLGSVPLLLVAAWWWTRRMLKPLSQLTQAARQIESTNIRLALPDQLDSDEVRTLANVLAEMTARLDTSFQQIREFTLHASHELKTPLTVMRAQLETVMREDAARSEPQMTWIENQLDEIRRLTHIVDSLTLLTKADAGLVKLESEPLALATLVEEAYEDAQVLAQPHSVSVALVACQPLTVRGDRHRLRQLLLILTDNAVKYNHPGGSVSLSLQAHPDHAELRVTNTGTPPDPQSLDNLFQRFARGTNAAGIVDGCGLGLTIAQWIVHAHHGSIQLTLDPNGQTTATVILPRENAERLKS